MTTLEKKIEHEHEDDWHDRFEPNEISVRSDKVLPSLVPSPSSSGFFQGWSNQLVDQHSNLNTPILQHSNTLVPLKPSVGGLAGRWQRTKGGGK
jgi:hypothetical protein